MSALLRPAAAAALIALIAGPLAAQEAAPAADAAPPVSPAPIPASEAAASTVLAVVNGQEITLGNLIALIGDLPEQYQQLPDQTLFNAVLDQMIQQLALSEGFKDPTRAEGLTLQNQDRAVRAGLAVQRILNEPVSEAELQAAYDKQFAEAAPQQEYHAAHILVETEAEAREIAEALKGGADFAEIAREKSTDPGSAASGGDLGWFGDGMMVPEFEQAVKALQPGQVSEPVQSQFGWHIVRLEETREVARPTLDEMREQLTDQVKGERVEAAIASAQAAASIDRSGAAALDPAAIRRSDLLAD